MNLFDPTKIKSLNGNHFVFVLVDDFSHFTWVFVLEHKDQAFSHFNVFRKRVEIEKGFLILGIRSGRGGWSGENCAQKVYVLKSIVKSACFGFLNTFIIA